jgi:hypothetical protein
MLLHFYLMKSRTHSSNTVGNVLFEMLTNDGKVCIYSHPGFVLTINSLLAKVG